MSRAAILNAQGHQIDPVSVFDPVAALAALSLVDVREKVGEFVARTAHLTELYKEELDITFSYAGRRKRSKK